MASVEWIEGRGARIFWASIANVYFLPLDKTLLLGSTHNMTPPSFKQSSLLLKEWLSKGKSLYAVSLLTSFEPQFKIPTIVNVVDAKPFPSPLCLIS